MASVSSFVISPFTISMAWLLKVTVFKTILSPPYVIIIHRGLFKDYRFLSRYNYNNSPEKNGTTLPQAVREVWSPNTGLIRLWFFNCI
jgi:hypothetical protein